MVLAILFFFEAIGRTDLLHPHPASPFKTSKVFLKDIPKCLFARHSDLLPVNSVVPFIPHKTVTLLWFRILKSGSVVVYTPQISVISQARRNLAWAKFRECLLPLGLLSTRTNKRLKCIVLWIFLLFDLGGKLDLSQLGSCDYVGWGCSIIGRWGRYMGLRVKQCFLVQIFTQIRGWRSILGQSLWSKIKFNKQTGVQNRNIEFLRKGSHSYISSSVYPSPLIEVHTREQGLSLKAGLDDLERRKISYPCWESN